MTSNIQVHVRFYIKNVKKVYKIKTYFLLWSKSSQLFIYK
jgi:hypothetical protein